MISVRNKTTGLLEPVASMPAVDGVLSADSTNPIANKAVYAALQEAYSVSGASDVELTSLTDGQVLKYDATSGKWVNGTGGATIDELGDIEDVDLDNLTDGQTIVWDATNSKWVNGEGGKTYTNGYLINIDSNDQISGKVFVGTGDAWDELTPSEQAEYDMINITDDYKTTSDIEIIYVDNLPVTGIKDVIYGLVNYNYSSAAVADGFLDDVSVFTKVDGTGEAYDYTSATAQVSTDGINYASFTVLSYDGTGFELDGTAIATGATFYWRTVANKTYFAGRAEDQTLKSLGYSGGGGGSAIRITTMDSSLFGTTVIVTGGVEGYEVITAFDNDGVALAEGVLEVGNIQIILDNGEKTKTYYLEVPYYSFYEISVIIDFDYKEWLTYGNLDPDDYESLSEVFADEDAVRQLMMTHSSVNYLVTNFSGDLDLAEVFVENETAMKWIGLSNYAADNLILANGMEDLLLESDYWQKYLKDTVPVMTADAEPIGNAISNGSSGTYYNWKAFNGTNTDGNDIWASPDNIGWIGYKFPYPVCVKKFTITTRNDAGGRRTPSIFTLQGSQDGGSTWTTIEAYTNDINTQNTTIPFVTNNNDYYNAYRIHVTDTITTASTTTLCLGGVQFYGRACDKMSAKMTSNTTPFNTASASSAYDTSTYPAWKAFDDDDSSFWCSAFLGSCSNVRVTYAFDTLFSPKYVKLKMDTTNISSNKYKIQGSVNGTSWDDLTEERNDIPNGTIVSLNRNGKAYKYVSVFIVSQTLINQFATGRIFTCKFYGNDMDEHEFAAEPNSIKLVGDVSWFKNNASNFLYFTDGNTNPNTFDASNNHLIGNPNYYLCTWLTTSKTQVSLTDYSKMIISCEGRVKDSNSRYWRVGFCDNRPSSYNSYTYSTYVGIPVSTTVTRYDVVLDISNVQGAKYLTMNGVYNHGKIWNIELIK